MADRHIDCVHSKGKKAGAIIEVERSCLRGVAQVLGWRDTRWVILPETCNQCTRYRKKEPKSHAEDGPSSQQPLLG